LVGRQGIEPWTRGLREREKYCNLLIFKDKSGVARCKYHHKSQLIRVECPKNYARKAFKTVQRVNELPLFYPE
jgi:hypothetical protein